MVHEWTKEEFRNYMLEQQAKRKIKNKSDADAYEVDRRVDMKYKNKRKAKQQRPMK